MQEKEKRRLDPKRLAFAILLLLVACIFAYQRYRSVYPRRPEPVARPQPGPGAPPGPAEERQMREAFVKDMQLSQDQLDRLRDISKRHGEEGPAALGDILKEMGPYLSPAQQAKAREIMTQHMNREIERASKVLPPADLERFKNKLQQKMGQKEKEKPKPPPAEEE